jgi:hypothetical protein
VFGQNRHGVSWTSGRASSATLDGNERKHSVQITTMGCWGFRNDHVCQARKIIAQCSILNIRGFLKLRE